MFQEVFNIEEILRIRFKFLVSIERGRIILLKESSIQLRVMKLYRFFDLVIFFCQELENNFKYSKRFMYKDIYFSFIYIKNRNQVEKFNKGMNI